MNVRFATLVNFWLAEFLTIVLVGGPPPVLALSLWRFESTLLF
jgi:hypothetical protein